MDDAELILAAYLRWGENCVDHLLGDFAFAILDPREEKAVLRAGSLRHAAFYYHHSPGKHFVFASDARDVLRSKQVPYAINEGRVADFIVPQLEWIDYSSTFYEGVFRLPPAHTLTVTTSGMTIAEFWKPVPGPELGYKTDAEFCEGFLEVFTRAVHERLDVPENHVGSMLSGGMDSGSVTAVGIQTLRLSAAAAAADRIRGASPRCRAAWSRNESTRPLTTSAISGTQIIRTKPIA